MSLESNRDSEKNSEFKLPQEEEAPQFAPREFKETTPEESAQLDAEYKEKQSVRLAELEKELEKGEAQVKIMAEILRKKDEAKMADSEHADVLKERLAMHDSTYINENLKHAPADYERSAKAQVENGPKLDELLQRENALMEKANQLRQEAEDLKQQNFEKSPVTDYAMHELQTKIYGMKLDIDALKRQLE